MTARHTHIAAIGIAAQRIAGHQANGTFTRITDSMHGWPSAPTGPSSRGTIPDPVGNAALRHDHAADDLHAIDAKLRAATALLLDVLALAERYAARPAHDGDRIHSNNPDPGCTSCSRLPGHAGMPRWEPPYRASTTLADGTNPGPLCQYCYRTVRNTGTLPALNELTKHHDNPRTGKAA